MPVLPVSYTTVQMMLVTLPELGSATSIRSSHLAQFAGEAEAEINGNIARLYALPFTVDVPLLSTLATDLAVYRILTRRRILSAERLDQSPWPARYSEALAILMKVAAGEIYLTDSAGKILPGRTDIAEVWSTTRDFASTMWEGDPAGEFVDTEKLDAEAARRGTAVRDRLL